MRKLFINATLCTALIACTASETPENTSKTDAQASIKSVAEFPFAPQSARIDKHKPPTQAELDTPTRVIMLGTGTPVPDTFRAGPSIAVVHKGESFIFDVGAGAVQNAVKARYKYDIPSLYPSHINHVFITHMHSDHVMDLSELSHTIWWRRPEQIKAYGPVGLKAMAENMAEMLDADVKTRMSGVQPIPNPEGYIVNVTEISPGIIYDKNGMTVEAFIVPHGDIKPAFGYKVTTEDLSIVISGDTADSTILREKAKNVDILFHEVISASGLAKSTQFWQNYHKTSHTSSVDVGKVAAAARPKKLVLYHGLHYGNPETEVVNEVAEYFDGDVHLANDLDIFE